MRVLLLSDVQEVGGAGIAAGRLGDALKNAGHEVIWLAGRLDQPPRFDSQSYAIASGLSRMTLKLTQYLDEARYDATRSSQLAQRVEQRVEEINPDVISVHNIHGMRLPANLPMRLSQTRPVVWTLHDMWAFTGTCTYTMNCDAFISRCTHDCPQHTQYPTLGAKRVPKAFDRRLTALKQAGQLAFATPSVWLMHQAKRGMLRDQFMTPIANSVDLQTYRPRNQHNARRALGIKSEDPVLLTTATMGDSRKGCRVLIKALEQTEQPMMLLSFNASLEKILPAHIAHHTLSATRDDFQLAMLYNAADLHVLPTLADNLPNTLLEAAACGTPSVATNVGGVSEAIETNTTGWLCDPNDSASLAHTIQHALSSIDADTPRHCRELAKRNFTPPRQAQAYTELFEQLIHRSTVAA